MVNMVFNLSTEAGIIGFQAQTAEIYYRNIPIKAFEAAVPIELFFLI